MRYFTWQNIELIFNSIQQLIESPTQLWNKNGKVKGSPISNYLPTQAFWINRRFVNFLWGDLQSWADKLHCDRMFLKNLKKWRVPILICWVIVSSCELCGMACRFIPPINCWNLQCAIQSFGKRVPLLFKILICCMNKKDNKISVWTRCIKNYLYNHPCIFKH